MPEDNNAALFTPTTAGSLSLKNRIVYARGARSLNMQCPCCLSLTSRLANIRHDRYPAMTRARFVDSIANDAVVKCKHQSPPLLRLRSPLIPLSVRAQTIRPVHRQA